MPRIAARPASPPRIAPSPDSALIDFEGVVAIAHPLGRTRTRQLKREDPRFPKPLFGKGVAGSKEVWSREKVALYFKQLASDGPVSVTS